ncbi:hypothetical protein GPJ61_05835 [Brevibacillus formosus]|uniref:DUF6492 family protein n=1 Tax=Brevibacillus formosus TaxID=54913 RepID=UPI001C71A7BF|nr:DUF6492 family protein [Brevibacillus formosus]MBW5467391.1 hypothetical protein [Brevibacillus formosus]
MTRSAKSTFNSSIKIDVLIPAIEKDLGTLPYVIDSIRKQVKHPVGRIMVVSPPSKRIQALCRRKNCTFINEKRVLPITKKDIHYQTKRTNRSGWLLQQLLKLAGGNLTKQRYYLVIDADTILIRPHVFLVNGKTVFYCRNWSRPEYFRTYKKLMGTKPTASRSFVAHYMLFDKSKLSRLKSKIEARHKTRWYWAIIKKTNKQSYAGFSEFETYGNFVKAHYPGHQLVISSLNKSLSSKPASLTRKRIVRLAQKYRSISFHKRGWYIRKKKSVRK